MLKKKNGILLIDHRNYDNILDTGNTPAKSLYYNTSHTVDIKTSVLLYCGKPAMITMDYQLLINNELNEFRLSYYPHILNIFTENLKEIFGYDTKHQIYGDFKTLDRVSTPAFYIHLLEKKKIKIEYLASYNIVKRFAIFF